MEYIPSILIVGALQMNKLSLMPLISILQLSPISLIGTLQQITDLIKPLPIFRIQFPVL